MDVFVQSAGYSEDFDYCWQPSIPNIIRNNRIYDLIQSESQSIVLARYGKKLLLLITGLKSTDKKDFCGRIIRNSVAWVCEDNHKNEQFLRGIAVCALRDLLNEQVDKAIKFGGEYGFEVDSNSLTSFNIELKNNSGCETKYKLGKNSESLRKKLANELEESCLPTGNAFQNTPLVVVTGNKSEATLNDARVWRGLSNLVKANEGEWKEVRFQPQTKETENDKPLVIIALIILLPVALLFIFLLAHPKAEQVQEVQRTSPPASPPIKQNAPVNNSSSNQKNDIKSYEEFKAVALSAYEQLNLDYNLDNLVPIYRIRRKIGELVTRENFNEWMLNMQSDNILELQSASLPDNDLVNLEDSITTDANGLLYYVKLFSTKAL